MIKNLYSFITVIGITLGLSVYVSADEGNELASVEKILGSLIPNAKPDSISDTVLPNMFEVIYGHRVFYISKNGHYFFEGDLYDLSTRTNLTEEKRRDGRAKVINKIDPETMIIFSPKDVKHTVTAFTDIDCGYCRKMHNQMAEYNKLGIAFRYLSYPRSGVNTPSYTKALSVWCAKDSQEAMSFAKGGAKLEQVTEIAQVEGKDCQKTVLGHMATARELDVSGTPNLVLENGQVVPGYVEPDRLIKMLDEIKKI